MNPVGVVCCPQVAALGEAVGIEEKMSTPAQQKVDQMRKHLTVLPQVDCPLIHRFTPGLYTRHILMPKGTLIISKIHLTEHPFVVIKGHAAVWIEGEGVVQIKAPYTGITKPGTRRVLFIHEECEWLTFHPTSKTTVDEVELEIIFPHKETENVMIEPEVMERLTAPL